MERQPTDPETTLEELLVSLPETLFRKILCGENADDEGFCTTDELCRFVRETKNEQAKQLLIQDKALWKALLEKEELPGETYHDLEKHMKTWDLYRKHLKMKLYVIVGSNTKKRCQDFLGNAIVRFMFRVATAHSWYKHLPAGADMTKFHFTLDLSSNRRRKDGRFIDYVDGDGTRFHYTWVTTAEYRRRYGCFCYGQSDTRSTWGRSQKKGSCVCWNNPEDDGYPETVLVPKSFQPDPVSVTAVVHGRTLILRHEKNYRQLLEAEINDGPGILKKTNLPAEAKGNLQMIAQTLLAAVDPDHSDLHYLYAALLDTVDTLVPGVTCTDLLGKIARTRGESSSPPNRDDYDGWSNLAMDLQRIRERLSMIKSLHQLCLLTYGDDLTPSLESILFAITKHNGRHDYRY
jgi:hypothetical protein